jgi:hypothetical protein
MFILAFSKASRCYAAERRIGSPEATPWVSVLVNIVIAFVEGAISSRTSIYIGI